MAPYRRNLNYRPLFGSVNRRSQCIHGIGTVTHLPPTSVEIQLRKRMSDTMANLIGALVGAAIDRQDGDSGIKGAIIGTVAESAIKVLVPIVATYAVGWVVVYAIGKAASATSQEAKRLLDSRDTA